LLALNVILVGVNVPEFLIDIKFIYNIIYPYILYHIFIILIDYIFNALWSLGSGKPVSQDHIIPAIL